MLIQKYTFMKQLFYLTCLSFIASCQYPLESYDQANKERFLLINAEITETYGKITVENSIDEITLSNVYSTPPPVTAEIYVEDSKGKRTYFQNKMENVNFKAEAGESYKLFVTADGKKFESTAEKMPVCPEMDSVGATFRQDLDYLASTGLRNAFDVNVYTKDAGNEVNYYQWDWLHNIRVLYCGTALLRGRPANLPCATDCWGIETSQKINVLSDALINGQKMRVAVARVPFQTPPNRYHLRVEQRAITKTAYDYFKSLEKQTQSNGTLFDVPAQTLFSPNIKGVEDPNQKVLGIFNVFSSRYKIIYIDMTQEIPGIIRKVIPDELPPYPYPYPSTPPCVEDAYKTKKKPEMWMD
jgi:hypothetical protein